MRQLKNAFRVLSWLLLFRCVYSQEAVKAKLKGFLTSQSFCFRNALKCVLLLNERGSVGCSQCGQPSIRGSLAIVNTQDMVNQINTGGFENNIIMTTESLAFSPKGVLETMDRRARAARAIIVAQHTEYWDENAKSDAVDNTSTEPATGTDQEPNFPFPPRQYYSADKPVPNEDYLFPVNATNPTNPRATGLLYGRWPTNIFYISDSDSKIIRKAFLEVQKRSKESEKGNKRTAPTFTMESRGEMAACSNATSASPEPTPGGIVSKSIDESENSKACLTAGTCLPVGGYSVWSSMSPINETTFNTSDSSKRRDIVAVTAPMDSAALFHDMAYGAAAEVASVAVLMAVVKSVGAYGRRTLLPLQRHPMYFAFNAQSWGFSGSGRFLEDVTSFECKSENSTDGFCNDPISPSLKFKALRNASFSVINLGGLVSQNKKSVDSTDPDYFMHGFESGNANGTGGVVEESLRKQFNRGSLSISDGFRNGSFMDASQSFQHYAPDADVVTLTDFKLNFTNRYYHSLFDNATLITPEARQPLYKAARAVAQTVIELSFGDANAEVGLEGDLIDDFIECLTTNWVQKNCSLAQEYLGDDYLSIYKTVYSSNYAGVFVPPDFAAEKNPTGYGKSMFLQRFMAYHTRLGPDGVITDNSKKSVFKSSACSNATQCERVDGATKWEPRNFKSTFCAKGACVSAESHLHAAFGTGLSDNNDARTRFDVQIPVPVSPDASPSPSVSVRIDPVQPAWTESTWGNNLDLCYRVEDTPLFGGAVLGSGLATFAICLITAFFLNPSRTFFKADSDVIHGQPIPDVQP